MPYVVNFLPLARINFRSNFFKFNNYSTTDNSTDIFFISAKLSATYWCCLLCQSDKHKFYYKRYEYYSYKY